MGLVVQEIKAKSILSKSGIPGVDYCINPYVGCSHACKYCYATFMKKYTGHTEEWGYFIDAKINAPDILRRQLKKAKPGAVMLSSVTDAYQPAEAGYKLTRQCLETLLEYQFPVGILTKSPLVLRDLDVIKKFDDIEVGLTVTTDNERIRKIFEPHAPSIEARINALKTLHKQGIKTYAFIGPVLPMDPERLAQEIRPYVHRVLIDRMNYVSKTRGIYTRFGLNQWFDKTFTVNIMQRLKSEFSGKDASIC
ncbi:MAG: radical SAM protein [Nitrospirae bacterium]|nr:radical SAM protein [Nitrospirota bacterium]MCL5238441.1 radical SAM protein [Nitrospirota bacterium]